MRSRTLAALSGVATLLVALAKNGPSIVADALFRESVPAWLPQVGSIGQSVTIYLQVGNAVGAVVTWSLVLGLGYYAGRRTDVDREYRRVGTAVAAGSVATVGLVAVGLSVAGGTSLDGVGVLLGAVTFAQAVAVYTLPVVVGVLAGAALVAFEADDSAPARPAENGAVDDEDTRTGARERATEHEGAGLQPGD